MKKCYEAAEINIVLFDTCDVIVASNVIEDALYPLSLWMITKQRFSDSAEI